MKKLISMLLALLLIMSLSSAAFAANQDAYFSKTYKLTNAGTTSPEESFTFRFSNGTVTDAADGTAVPTIPDATVNFAAGDAATDTGLAKQVNVSLSGITWPSVGIYTYDVTEVQGNTAGVTYSNATLKMKVTVAYDDQTQTYYTAFVTMSLVDSDDDGITDGTKTGNFENTYSAGSLAVTKTVTGNMGDRSKYFAINVTLTGEADKTYAASYTVTGGTKLVNGTDDATTSTIFIGTPATFYLKHGETFTISNLPYGVTYTVTEKDYTAEENGGYDTPAITYSDAGTTKTVDSPSETVGITNNKGANVDTGISLDSLPYILLLVISLTGAVVFIVKRRSSRES